MDQFLPLCDRIKPFEFPTVFMQLTLLKYLLWLMLSAREDWWVSKKTCWVRGSGWQSDQSPGTLYRTKMGIAKRARSGMKTRKSEKPSIDAGAVLGSCPWAKINSPWQWDKMLILAPARGRQPKSQLRWSNELGDLRGLRPPWLLAGCGALQAVYWNRVCVPSPPLWAGSQNNQKCRWHVALNDHPKLPLGGRRSSTGDTGSDERIPAPGQDNAKWARHAQERVRRWTLDLRISVTLWLSGSEGGLLFLQQNGHLMGQEWVWVAVNLEWLAWGIDKKGSC